MALIDPKGLLYGERLGDCSDDAQLHWPRLFAASNGYGRIELSVEHLNSVVYSSFKKKPTAAFLSKLFDDYAANWLLFIYQAKDGSLWGQWITSEKFLSRYKTMADQQSPAPDPEAVEEYKKQYISSRKAKYLCVQRFHKSSEDSQKFPCREGIGEGIGEGKNTIPSGIESADADAPPPQVRPEDFANLWNQQRGENLAKVAEFTKSRRQKTKIRMNAGLTLERFTEAVARCRGVPFLRGENDRGWRASYDWLMANDTNIAKVLEGRYSGSPKAPKQEGFYERLQRELEADEAELDAVGSGSASAG